MNGLVPKNRTSPFHDAISQCVPRLEGSHAVIKSRSWLRSGFDRWGRSSSGSSGWGSGGAAARGATGGAGGSWSTAGRSTAALGSAAATGAWLAATNAGWTAAATSFSVSTNTQQNRDRSSSRKTEHTTHPGPPSKSWTEIPNAAADPRRPPPQQP